MMENENNNFTNISSPFLRSCSQHDQERDKNISKLLTQFSVIAFNAMKLPVIRFIIKLISQINTFKLQLNLTQNLGSL